MLESEGEGDDYTVLRSTDKQIKGIKLASQILENKLGIDKDLVRGAFVEVYTEMQIEESRYHYQTENDLPQIKLALKKMLEPMLKSKLNALIQSENMWDEIDRAIDHLFHWYMKEYLPKNII
ncbi:MAG: hypothetical protein ACC656_05735 [Candidatus Heimdallarchaeota archaeon]